MADAGPAAVSSGPAAVSSGPAAVSSGPAAVSSASSSASPASPAVKLVELPAAPASPAVKLLHSACETNNVTLLTRLLEQGHSPDSKKPNGVSLLQAATTAGATGCVRELLAVGAVVDAMSNTGFWAAHQGVHKGHADCLRLLLAAKADANKRTKSDSTLLAMAAERNAVGCVAALLEHRADVTASRPQGDDGIADTPLTLAARKGHFDCVKLLLNEGADPNQPRAGPAAWPPLMIAASSGHMDCVALLIQHRAECDATSAKGFFALYVACEHQHEGCARVLLEHGANVNKSTLEKGRSPLHIACKKGHDACARLLLEGSAEVNQRDCMQQTALHAASRSGRAACVTLLLAHRADTSLATAEAALPALFEAAIGGHAECVQLLLQGAADPNQRLLDGSVALLEAIGQAGCEECVTLLLDHRADVDATDAAGFWPLWCACSNALDGCARLLLEAGADVNKRFAEKGLNKTCLIMTIEDGSYDCASVLIKAGADVNASGRNGEPAPRHRETSALLIACQRDHEDCVELLLESRANAHLRTETIGETPLHLACGGQHSDLLPLLFARGVSANARTNEGRTPLHYAASMDGQEDEAAHDLEENDPNIIHDLVAAHKASIEAVSNAGETPLAEAIKKLLYNAAGTLICHGARVEAVSSEVLSACERQRENPADEHRRVQMLAVLKDAQAIREHYPVWQRLSELLDQSESRLVTDAANYHSELDSALRDAKRVGCAVLEKHNLWANGEQDDLRQGEEVLRQAALYMNLVEPEPAASSKSAPAPGAKKNQKQGKKEGRKRAPAPDSAGQRARTASAPSASSSDAPSSACSSAPIATTSARPVRSRTHDNARDAATSAELDLARRLGLADAEEAAEASRAAEVEEEPGAEEVVAAAAAPRPSSSSGAGPSGAALLKAEAARARAEERAERKAREEEAAERKAHAAAMRAVDLLRACTLGASGSAADVEGLRAAIAAAELHTRAIPALAADLEQARVALHRAEQQPRQPTVAGTPNARVPQPQASGDASAAPARAEAPSAPVAAFPPLAVASRPANASAAWQSPEDVSLQAPGALPPSPPLPPVPPSPFPASPFSATAAASGGSRPLTLDMVQLLEEWLTCPITSELMHDPVMAADGHTYERDAIQRWLRAHDTSPFTGEQLEHTRLTPNHLVRGLALKLQEVPQSDGPVALPLTTGGALPPSGATLPGRGGRGSRPGRGGRGLRPVE